MRRGSYSSPALTSPRTGCTARFQLPRPARVVARHHFDAALRGLLLELGGRVEEGVRVEHGVSGGEGVAWAVGRTKALGACRWVGLKAHFHGLAAEADLEMHAGYGAYVGLCEIAPGTMNVSGLFRASKIPCGSARDWRSLLERHGLGALARRLASARMLPGSLCSVSHLRFGWNPCQSALRVGDARAVIPPLAGNGLSLAIETAMLAAPLLEGWSAGALSWNKTMGAARRICHERLARRLRLAGAAQCLLMWGPARELFGCFSAAGIVPWRQMFLLLGS